MSKILDVTAIAFDEAENKTTISYHTYLTDSIDENSAGTWEAEGNLTQEQAVEYAKTMLEPELKDTTEVSFNPDSPKMPA